MFRGQKMPKASTIRVNESFEGESIEKKVDRIVNNKEPIKDGAPLVYTARRDGVKPELNIRTDRWELAIDAMDYVTKDKLTKRQDREMKRQEELNASAETKGIIGGTESTAPKG